MKARLSLFMALTLLVGGWAQRPGISAAQSSSTTPAALIEITDGGLSARILQVVPGTVVSWLNTTSTTHIVVNGTPQQVLLPLVLGAGGAAAPRPAAPAPLDAAQAPAATELFRAAVPPGGRFSYTFTAEATVPFFLADAPDVRGSVTVLGARAGFRTVSYDRASGLVTVDLSGASLVGLIELLRTSFDLDIIVADLADVPISGAFTQVDIETLLGRLLPSGATYHYNTRGADLDRTGRSGSRGQGAAFPPNTIPKGREPAPVINIAKAAAGQTPPIRTGPASKPRTGVVVPSTPKPPTRQDTGGVYTRLHFQITAAGQLTVDSYDVLPGLLQRPALVEGALVYALYINGTLVDVGSLPEPLARVAYNRPKLLPTHLHGQQARGQFSIPLSRIMADASSVAGASIVFSRIPAALPAGATLPTELTTQTYGAFTSLLQPVRTVPSSELVAAFNARRRPAALPAATTVTQLLNSGNPGSKKNLVIIGDGFQSGQQAAFNTFVDNYVMKGVFSDDALRETMSAFNIYRVNADSVSSGVTQVNSTGAITVSRNTALDYHYSGIWGRCWMENGPNTESRLKTILDATVPQRDYVFVILNEPGFGGCSDGSSRLVVTNSSGDWTVAAHEMGHMVGALGDEYTNGASGAYTGGEPAWPNLTKNTTRSTIKWKQFVDPSTPLPTKCSDVSDAVQDVGAFVGATTYQSQWSSGIWVPTCDSRMSSNTPVYNPVGYQNIRQLLAPRQNISLSDAYRGDFNGDGLTDTVLHQDNSLALFLAQNSRLQIAWQVTGKLPGWDDFQPGDTFYVGDFSGDGKDDLFVVNTTDYPDPYFGLLRSTGTGFECVRLFFQELPGWDDMRSHDQFYVGDFNGDGKDDLAAFNARDWSDSQGVPIGYLEIFRSTGTDLAMVKRFDDQLPGWDSMRANDQFYVANFDGDARDDFYVFNGRNWDIAYLETLRSTGTDLVPVQRFDDQLPGWDSMRANDQFYVADFNHDSRDDLYVFNGRDWDKGYLELLASLGPRLSPTVRYDGAVPGWDLLEPNDQFFVADVNGDGREDLYAFNALDWGHRYLGLMRSSGTALSTTWHEDWVNGWQLSSADQFLPADYAGAAHFTDLFIHNANYFGLLRSQQSRVVLTSIYPSWIHTYRYEFARLVALASSER